MKNSGLITGQWISVNDFDNYPVCDAIRMLALFDNGEIRRYVEDFPFAEITHLFVLPEFPKK